MRGGGGGDCGVLLSRSAVKTATGHCPLQLSDNLTQPQGYTFGVSIESYRLPCVYLVRMS